MGLLLAAACLSTGWLQSDGSFANGLAGDRVENLARNAAQLYVGIGLCSGLPSAGLLLLLLLAN